MKLAVQVLLFNIKLKTLSHFLFLQVEKALRWLLRVNQDEGIPF